jgi:putative membrane protein
MNRWMTTAILTIGIAIAPAWAHAQSTTVTDKPAAEKKADRSAAKADRGEDKAKLTSGDRTFMTQALRDNMAEVELGKLASEKASNDSVKQFGKRMVDDHGKAVDELKTLAADKGVTAPTDLDATHKKLHDRLSKLSGAEFDRVYVDEMVKDHRKDVKAFQQEADKAKDPDLKSWASKTLPTLQDHMKTVEDVQTQVKGTAKAAKTEKK